MLQLLQYGQIKHDGRQKLLWSDEEISLLLHVFIDYKAGKAGEGVDWETVRSKYEDVTKCFWTSTLITINSDSYRIFSIKRPRRLF